MIEYALYNWVFASSHFAKCVKEGREAAGLNRAEFASIMDVSSSTIATWESGRSTAPMPSHFLAICNHLELDPRDFWEMQNTGKRAKRS